jgi:hypothetical protein
VVLVRTAEGDALAAALASILDALPPVALATIAAKLRPHLLGAGEGDPWLDHTLWPFPRRKALRLALSGAFEVRKVGRRWLARRSAIDAFIVGHAPTARPSALPANDAGPVDELAALRRELHLAPVDAPRARRARGGR